MPIAVDIVLKLISVFMGGLWTCAFVSRRKYALDQWQVLALGLTTGCLNTTFFFLLTDTFEGVFWINLAIGIVSALFIKAQWSRIEIWQYGLIAIGALMAFPVLFTALEAWDARSIWFFHAKILHFEKSLASLHWNWPEYGFAHAGYPKTYPILTAYLMSSWPFWNAYLPKIVLWLFIATGLFSLLSLRLRPALTWLLALCYFGIPGVYIWNGYLDAYVAMFSALGMLSLAQSFKDQGHYSFLLGVFLLGLVAVLKQEGLAISLAILLSTLIVRPQPLNAWIAHRNYLGLITLPIAVLLVWTLRKHQLSIEDYFTADGSMASRFVQKIFSLDALKIFSKGMASALIDIFVFVLLYCGLSKWKQNQWLSPLSKPQQWILISAGFYLLILFVVYLGSPFDLEWYLHTSARRVLLTVKFFALTAFTINWFDGLAVNPSTTANESN